MQLFVSQMTEIQLVVLLVLVGNTYVIVLGGARQVLISRGITLRHKELKIVRLTLIYNHGKTLFFEYEIDPVPLQLPK